MYSAFIFCQPIELTCGVTFSFHFNKCQNWHYFACKTFGNPEFDRRYVKAVPGCRMMKVSGTALSMHSSSPHDLAYCRRTQHTHTQWQYASSL